MEVELAGAVAKALSLRCLFRFQPLGATANDERRSCIVRSRAQFIALRLEPSFLSSAKTNSAEMTGL
ncbi:hypothetical protein PQQ96_33150 [Paraburkholderia sediminicola]|uniref:hypothetical protein n=1 Tax=Paraburkholderia sediminicola TaxID=458836 RepID=UPI0038BAE6BA